MYDYCITTNGELFHYGVLGMKWGVRKGEHPIGQNYNVKDQSGGGGEPEEDEEDAKEELTDALLEKFDTFLEDAKLNVEAGEAWLAFNLHTKVVDVITGKAEYTSFKEIKDDMKFQKERIKSRVSAR